MGGAFLHHAHTRPVTAWFIRSKLRPARGGGGGSGIRGGGLAAAAAALVAAVGNRDGSGPVYPSGQFDSAPVYPSRQYPVYPSGQYRYGSNPAPVATPSVVSPVVRVAPVAAPTVRPAVATAAPAAAPSCLTKEYLQAGVVLFKDVCTKEWAMNSTSVPSQPVSQTNSACLTKEYPRADIVLFKDTCTNEWAMNPPPEQQAQASQPPRTQ